MEKSMKDNSEYRTKRQWFFIVLICLLVMVFFDYVPHEKISSEN